MGAIRAHALQYGILDSLAWGVMVVGRRSRDITIFNRAMSEITGVPRAHAVGRTVAEVFSHIEGLDLEALDSEISESGGFEARNLRLVRPGGEVVFRHVRGDVLEGPTRDEDGVVVSVMDVTEREYLRLGMSRYLAREVMDQVLASRPGEPIQGREVEVAVLVADMRDFTAAAEGLTPEELFETLNAYLAPMVEIVARHRGMIDKFTGDGFMAVFGFPRADGEEVDRTLAAALELRHAVEGVAAHRDAEGLPSLGLGYGIHCGPAIAGSLGSLLRMDYTVIGDTVNVAHRVQGLARSGEILATRTTMGVAREEFRWGEGRWVRIRGRKAPVKVHPLEGRVGA